MFECSIFQIVEVHQPEIVITEYATSLSHTTGDFDFQLPDIPELVNEPDCGGEKGEETLEQAKQKLRRQRGKRARGLSFLAEDVIER